jgi:hypothetical protein
MQKPAKIAACLAVLKVGVRRNPYGKKEGGRREGRERNAP